MSGGSSKKRLESLDAIRGVCAILVMAMHARFLTGYDPFPSAYWAVDIFFMMSGFVIAHAYDAKLQRRGYFPIFVWRRYSRLVPMWAIGLSIGVAFMLIFHHREPNHFKSLLFYIPALLFIPASYLVDGPQDFLFPYNSPGWSLFFEMLANLAYGLLARWATTKVLIMVMVVGAVGLVLASLHHGDLNGGSVWATVDTGLARTVFGFSVGLLFYRMRERVSGPRRPAWLFALALIGLVVLIHLSVPATSRRLVDPAIILIVCPMILWLGLNIDAGLPRVAEALGALSYPLYAIHFPLMTVFFFVHGYLTQWKAGHQVLAPAAALAWAGSLVAVAYLLGRYGDPAVKLLAGRLARRRPVETSGPALIDPVDFKPASAQL